MTIREVCEKYNLKPDTLRYYERVGVIPEVKRTAGGIRYYQEENIGWVEKAVCMRNAGVPGIQLDECELPMTSINSGGCFCDSCMKQFRQWLKDRRPVALTPEGIQRPDIETFRTGDIVTIRLKNAGLYTVIAV